MALINTQTYVMQLALMVAAVYSAEFCYLNMGIGVAFMKLVQLAMLLFAIHVTWALLARGDYNFYKSVSIFSRKIGIQTLLKWNFALIYANISAMILRDYILLINGIPIHLIYVSSIMFLHMGVAAIIIKLALETIPSHQCNKKP